ncbi:MAG: dihydrodipicolinate synthase family protein [Acidimicrobiales bacterium]
MGEYRRDNARDWAKEHMRGVCGCLLPTFNTSLTQINEAAIRHDIRREAELGYWGTLLVSECGTTTAEMRQVIDIAVDEASRCGLATMLLAAFPTLLETIEMVRYGRAAGVDLALLSYPLTFHPRSEEDVFAFTRAVAEASDLALMLFCVHQWDFGYLHPSGFSPDLVGRLLDELPSIVAVKNEVGGPGVGGIADIFRRFGERVVVSDPFEQNAPAWVPAFGMQFMGSSNYEYLGAAPVRMFELLQAEKFDEAMEIYWRVHPARQANAQLAGSYMPGAGLIHRMLWKYQYWLNGFNGGPVRQPHLRLMAGQRALARRGLVDSGIEIAPGDDDDFFVGRCPMD